MATSPYRQTYKWSSTIHEFREINDSLTTIGYYYDTLVYMRNDILQEIERLKTDETISLVRKYKKLKNLYLTLSNIVPDIHQLDCDLMYRGSSVLIAGLLCDRMDALTKPHEENRREEEAFEAKKREDEEKREKERIQAYRDKK